MIKVINEFGLSDLEELLIEIGKGNIKSRDVLNFYIQKKIIEKKIADIKKTTFTRKYEDQGAISGMAIHYAHCCHPLPGERIVGIVTTGKGITVHALDYFALEKFNDMPEVWLEISWERGWSFHKGSLVTICQMSLEVY